MSVLMDSDVDYYWVPLVSALQPQSPTDFVILMYLGAMHAIDSATWHFNTSEKEKLLKR